MEALDILIDEHVFIRQFLEILAHTSSIPASTAENPLYSRALDSIGP